MGSSRAALHVPSAEVDQPRHASPPPRSAYARTQLCIAIAAAELALMDRVEPNWAIEKVPSQAVRAL